MLNKEIKIVGSLYKGIGYTDDECSTVSALKSRSNRKVVILDRNKNWGFDVDTFHCHDKVLKCIVKEKCLIVKEILSKEDCVVERKFSGHSIQTSYYDFRLYFHVDVYYDFGKKDFSSYQFVFNTDDKVFVNDRPKFDVITPAIQSHADSYLEMANRWNDNRKANKEKISEFMATYKPFMFILDAKSHTIGFYPKEGSKIRIDIESIDDGTFYLNKREDVIGSEKTVKFNLKLKFVSEEGCLIDAGQNEIKSAPLRIETHMKVLLEDIEVTEREDRYYDSRAQTYVRESSDGYRSGGYINGGWVDAMFRVTKYKYVVIDNNNSPVHKVGDVIYIEDCKKI